MNQLKAPTELGLSGNVQDNWNKFKQRFELYLTATGMSDKPESRSSGSEQHLHLHRR